LRKGFTVNIMGYSGGSCWYEEYPGIKNQKNYIGFNFS
jgi:hypothetical protein